MRRSILVDARPTCSCGGWASAQALEIARAARARRVAVGHPRHVRDRAREDELPADARVVPSFEELAARPRAADRALPRRARGEQPELAAARAGARRRASSCSTRRSRPPTQAEVDSLLRPALPPRVAPRPRRGGRHRRARARALVASTRTAAAWPTARSARSRSTRAARSRAAARSRSCARPRRSPAHHDFRGTITDVGGPTANMYGLGCKLLEKGEPCLGRDCLTPDPCPALRLDKTTEGYRRLLALVRGDEGRQARLRELGHPLRHAARTRRASSCRCTTTSSQHHVPGRMKLAPEHASADDAARR